MNAEREQMLQELRPGAFAIAYRMLGSVAEAEDVVQDALLKLDAALVAAQQIRSPRAFLATVTTRLAIDQLRSARVRRERYVGDWLPEPILTDAAADPASCAELEEAVSLAMLVLLESLSPEQRAAFLLHDVFDYDYEEIAAIIGKSEANVRQLAARARRHVKERRPRFAPSPEQRWELAERFFEATHNGDVKSLESLLAHDVVLTGDGGGKVPALARSLYGRDHVARTLLAWLRVTRRLAVSIHPSEVNGHPGALLLDSKSRVAGVWALDIADGEIQAIRSVVNPDKLRHLGTVADVRELVKVLHGEGGGSAVDRRAGSPSL